MKEFKVTNYTGTIEELGTIKLRDHDIDWDLFADYVDFVTADYPGEKFNVIFAGFGKKETFIILPAEKELYEEFVGEKDNENTENDMLHILATLEKYHNYPGRVKRAMETLIDFAEDSTKNYSASGALGPLTFVTALDTYINKLRCMEKINIEKFASEVNKVRGEN